MMDPYWHEHHQAGSGWLIVMIVFMVALVAAVVALVVLLSRRATPAGPSLPAVPPAAPVGPPPAPGVVTDNYDTAARMLAERFALGEIDEAEFKARLAVLRGTAG